MTKLWETELINQLIKLRAHVLFAYSCISHLGSEGRAMFLIISVLNCLLIAIHQNVQAPG